MTRILNLNKASITLEAGSANQIVLNPGINEVEEHLLVALAPDTLKYAQALHDAGIISVDGMDSIEETQAPTPEYARDEEGNLIQKVDEDGEPVFDETTGEPVYVLASEVEA